MLAELRFEKTIQASLPQVFRMFTNAIGLREWLCDQAFADARPGGYFSVVWNNGYFANGTYNEVLDNSEVAVTWRGKNDPEPSQVRVLLEGEGGATRMTVIHSGLGDEGPWEQVREDIRQSWETGLENLAHVLEKGPDLRIINRPMLGVVIGEFSPEVAERLNVPLRSGVRLDVVMDGMGAQKAGLQKDDVFCEINGKGLNNFNDVTTVLQGKRAGDVVEVTYYRGPEKFTTQMELARRPMPEVPMEAEQLAEAVEKIYQEDYAGLQSTLVGVSEEEAGHHPTETEWSVKDVIAHLLINERANQYLLAGQVLSQLGPGDGFVENLLAQVRATALVYGTVEALMEGLKLAQEETVQLLRGLPQEFVNRKSSMWLMGYNLLAFPFHGSEHNEQIRMAIEGARMV